MICGYLTRPRNWSCVCCSNVWATGPFWEQSDYQKSHESYLRRSVCCARCLRHATSGKQLNAVIPASALQIVAKHMQNRKQHSCLDFFITSFLLPRQLLLFDECRASTCVQWHRQALQLKYRSSNQTVYLVSKLFRRLSSRYMMVYDSSASLVKSKWNCYNCKNIVWKYILFKRHNMDLLLPLMKNSLFAATLANIQFVTASTEWEILVRLAVFNHTQHPRSHGAEYFVKFIFIYIHRMFSCGYLLCSIIPNWQLRVTQILHLIIF